MPRKAPRARVVVVGGPSEGVSLEVGDKLTIGRRPENRLRLKDEQISRFHAVIERRGDHYLITDLGSRCGTSVDGKPLDVETIVLPDGARVQMGQTVLELQVFEGEFDEPVTLPDAPIYRGNPSPPSRRLPIPGSDQTEEHHFTLFPVPKTADLVKKQDDQLERVTDQLKTLLLANSIISTELDQEQLFERILDALAEAFPAHRAAIMTAEGGELLVRATRQNDPQVTDSAISNTIAYRALRERVGVLTLDAGADHRFDSRASIVDGNIRSAICAPMLHHEEVLGVIYLDTVGITHAFKDDDLRILSGIAGPAAVAVRNSILVSRLKETAIDTIFRLAVAAEYRDDDTGFHIHRMSDYAEEIARALGKSESYCELIKIASPMHDVGKIGIPDAILKKPSKLTSDEFELMKQHTVIGGAILSNSGSEVLQMAHNIALSHHEKFDGKGYPKGLSQEAIPLEGRIVAVADVFDAVMSKRCYKEAFGLEKSIEILTSGAGKHFDPLVVEAFMGVKDRILQIREHYSKLELQAEQAGHDVAAAFLRKPGALSGRSTLT
jgi:response regulator RpfG family c-di-GMP phosphodiesterase/pSer/pThr/pTyr-binding forkhead associated (FHA) protein